MERRQSRAAGEQRREASHRGRAYRGTEESPYAARSGGHEFLIKSVRES